MRGAAGLQDLPVASGSLRRFEFVSACEALLADSPGCASLGDLHALFDLLDPGCTGSVPLQKFSALLRAHQRPATKPGAPLWTELGPGAVPSTAAGRLKSALNGLRTWMLQHNLLFHDLANVFNGVDQRLPWPEFGDRLVNHATAPWITKQGAKEIFDQLKVVAVAPTGITDSSTLPSHEVRITDLVEALIDSKTFAEEMGKRTLRVVFREAHNRRLDVKQQFRVEDSGRTGLVDRKTLAKVLNSICPNALADADVGSLAAKFSMGPRFRYEHFATAIESERCLYTEHLLQRALPRLEAQAVPFLNAAKEIDRSQTGFLTYSQLRHALSKVDLGLVETANLVELDDFIEMLTKSSRLDKERFKYGKVVGGPSEEKHWIGPSVKECISVICGAGVVPKEYDDDGKKTAAPKEYLLALLFYKTSQAARKLGLSIERAFERLDRGGKGFLNAADLRLAVRDVLGADESLQDLGMKSDFVMRINAFENRLNFNLEPLSEHFSEVFGSVQVLREDKFVSGFKQKGVDEALIRNWLHLLCPGPTGVPPAGVQRCWVETVLATHPLAGIGPVAAERDLAHSLVLRNARKQMRERLQNLRSMILQEVGTTSSSNLPAWLYRPQVAKLLHDNLPKDEADAILDVVARTSALYAGTRPSLANTAGDARGDVLRTETLLVGTETYEEHILEVRLAGIKGLDAMHHKVKSQDRQLELSLRYWCRGTEYVAETARLKMNSEMALADMSAELGFTAKHMFNMNSHDSLLHLFEGVDEALSVQAWGGVVREPRQLLATAILPAKEMRDFLVASSSKKFSPEAVLGSQKEWRIPFADMRGPELTLTVLYSRRSPQDQMRPPLPWPSSFTGSLVLCHRTPFLATDVRDEIPGPVAAPTPGSVRLEVQLRSLVLHSHTLKVLLASCLEGCAMPAPVHGAGLGLFVRFCLFPGSPSLQVAGGCGWVQTSVTMLPEELLVTTCSDTVDVSMDFVWHSPMLDAGDAVAGLREGKASVELWLKTSCVPSAQIGWAPANQLSADMQLAAGSVNLKELLRAASPKEPEKLRLRTLRNVSIEPRVAFKADKSSDVLADLVTSISMDLPEGPSVVSWLVEPEKVDTQATYHVRLLEVWLSQEFAATLANWDISPHGSRQTGPDRPGQYSYGINAGAQYYFAEFGQGGASGLGGPAPPGAPTPTLPYYRSAPVAGQLEAGGWLRVPIDEDARVVLAKRPVLGNNVDSDMQIRRGDHHSMRVRVLRLLRGGGTRLAADVAVQLPLGEEKDGGQSCFFGSYMWRPLYFSAPEAPSMTIVGRAVVSVEALHTGDLPRRLLTYLPKMPTGVLLPLYSTSKRPVGKVEKAPSWPLEASLRSLVNSMHPELWAQLAANDSASKGVVKSEAFVAALEAASLDSELAFFQHTVAAFFTSAESPVPWMQLLYWFALRAIAVLVLPKMSQLLRRLQQLDKARGRMTGTVPFPTFRQALQDEFTGESASLLSPPLLELIQRKPQWSAGAAEFCGHAYFDYVAFLWDLNAAGAGEKVLFGDAPHMPSRASLENTAPSTLAGAALGGHGQSCDGQPYSDLVAMLTIVGAMHLPNATPNQSPSTFVSYCWGRKGDETGQQDGERLGATEVIYRDSSPKWNNMASVVLPPVQIGGHLLPYPDAYEKVILVLQVWCVDEWRGTERLIGSARMALEPLRLGFAEIDGYYDIKSPASSTDGASDAAASAVSGQIHASLTPRWAPGPLERGSSSPVRHPGPGSRPGWGSGPGLGAGAGPGSSSVLGPGTVPGGRQQWPGDVANAFLPSAGSTGHFSSLLLDPPPMHFEESQGLQPAALLAAPAFSFASPPPLPPPSGAPPMLPSNLTRPDRLPSAFTSANVFDRALRDQLYRPGLFDSLDADLRAVGRGPGVEDDVSTTALRFASHLSALEVRLRSMEGTEDEQMEELRARHRSNLATLDQLQQGMLPPIASIPAAEFLPTPPPLASMPLGDTLAFSVPSSVSAAAAMPSLAPPAGARASTAAPATVPSIRLRAPASVPANPEAPLYSRLEPPEIIAADLPAPASSNLFPQLLPAGFAFRVRSQLPPAVALGDVHVEGVAPVASGVSQPLPPPSEPPREVAPPSRTDPSALFPSLSSSSAALAPPASIASVPHSPAAVAPPVSMSMPPSAAAVDRPPSAAETVVRQIVKCRDTESGDTVGPSRLHYGLPRPGGSLLTSQELPAIPAMPGTQGYAQEFDAGPLVAPQLGPWPQREEILGTVGQYVGLVDVHLSLDHTFGGEGALPHSDISADLSSARQELLHQVGEDIRAGRSLDEGASV